MSKLKIQVEIVPVDCAKKKTTKNKNMIQTNEETDKLTNPGGNQIRSNLFQFIVLTKKYKQEYDSNK